MRPFSQVKAPSQPRGLRRAVLVAAVAAVSLTAVACERMVITRNHGYIVPPDALEQVPEGSSREQVDFVLGTPSTTANFGGEVFYYISQRTETVAFLAPRITDQRVIAVYFDEQGFVERVADYGLEDGRVVDFTDRTTPTSGAEVTFLRQIFSSATGQVND